MQNRVGSSSNEIRASHVDGLNGGGTASKPPGEYLFHLFQEWLRTLSRMRRVRLVVFGYVVVGVFGAGVALARWLNADSNTALIAGVIVALPLLFALLGDRITGLKAFSIEVSLSAVAAPIQGDFSQAIMGVAEMGASAAPELGTTILNAILGHTPILRLNLRDDNYWWASRLFLVAALSRDYTDVQAIVFVRSAEQRIFVGIASPVAVVARVGARFPDYQDAYRRVQSDLAKEQTVALDEQVRQILTWRWVNSLTNEFQDRVIVSTPKLKEWLNGELDDDDVPYGPLSPLLRYRVLVRPRRFAALTEASRVVVVVDRDELARRSAVAELERRLG